MVGFGSDEIPSDEVVEVDLVVVHPYYYEHDFDFAVIGLAENLNFSAKVQPVKLPDDGEIAEPGEMMLVSGWGSINEFHSKTEIELRSTEVPILDLNMCQRLYAGTSSRITPRMICAGFMKGGKVSYL